MAAPSPTTAMFRFSVIVAGPHSGHTFGATPSVVAFTDNYAEYAHRSVFVPILSVYPLVDFRLADGVSPAEAGANRVDRRSEAAPTRRHSQTMPSASKVTGASRRRIVQHADRPMIRQVFASVLTAPDRVSSRHRDHCRGSLWRRRAFSPSRSSGVSPSGSASPCSSAA